MPVLGSFGRFLALGLPGVLPFAALFALPAGAAAQCQLSRFQPADIEPYDSFGSSLSISGSTLVIGNPTDDDLATYSGAAYVYERVGNSWVEWQKLVASDGHDHQFFGSSVSIDGDLLVVGARGDGDDGPFAGSAYLFARQGWTWSEVTELHAADGSAYSSVGRAVSISGGRILLGSQPPVDPGAAYVFERSGSAWVQAQKLTASDAASGQWFGYAVVLRDDLAVIGAREDNGGRGAAYVFERTGSGWNESVKLTASNGFGFGAAVATDGARILVGAVSTQPAGAAYVYVPSGASWGLDQELVPSIGSVLGRFGSAVGILGDTAVVGADSNAVLQTGQGSAHAFDRRAGNWSEVATLFPAGSAGIEEFGFGLTMTDELVAIGARRDDNEGSVRIFPFEGAGERKCSCATGAPCGNEDERGGCRNQSWSRGALMFGCGSTSVTTDELVFTVQYVSRSQSGLLFMGPGEVELPFGGGKRCVGEGGVGLYRFPISPPKWAGVIDIGPGLVARTHTSSSSAFHIHAGETWHFQYWYRDPGGSCGTGFNLSNSVAVSFTP